MLHFLISETQKELNGQNTEISVINHNIKVQYNKQNTMTTNYNISTTQAREHLYFGNYKYTKRVKWSEHRHYGL